MAGVPIKAAAALKKTWKANPTDDDWDRLFKEAVRRAAKNSRTAYEAHRNPVFIKKMNAFLEKNG